MAYVVVSVTKYDTAASLSRKYNTTERSLFSLNNPRFYEGERLIVEVSDGRRYTVQPFDTLNSIAKKFNTTASVLEALNGVSQIFLGQSLVVPNEG